MLAADWDEKDAKALLKLASRARFFELYGNKLKGCVADLELYLECARSYYTIGSSALWLRLARKMLKK